MLMGMTVRIETQATSPAGTVGGGLPPAGPAIASCPYCGRPDAEPFQVVSRHRTSTGQTLWTRCECGSLQARVLDETGERVLARSRAGNE